MAKFLILKEMINILRLPTQFSCFLRLVRFLLRALGQQMPDILEIPAKASLEPPKK
jgi:hypothetical protein